MKEQIDRIEVELNELSHFIFDHELKVNEAKSVLAETQYNLTEKQCELILKGKVQGRNREQREAELWPHCKSLHKEVMAAQVKYDQAKARYNYYLRQYESAILIAKLEQKL